MEQKKKFSKDELQEQVRILRQMIIKNEEATEGNDAEEPEVVFSLSDVKTLCEMVLAALGKGEEGGDGTAACGEREERKEAATIRGQRRPRRGRRDGHRVVCSSSERTSEIAKRLIQTVNEYDDYADAANVMRAAVVLLCAVAWQIKEDSHGVKIGLEGDFDKMEPVLLASLRAEGKNYGLEFDEWLNVD